jgi:hypothetical protein
MRRVKNTSQIGPGKKYSLARARRQLRTGFVNSAGGTDYSDPALIGKDAQFPSQPVCRDRLSIFVPSLSIYEIKGASKRRKPNSATKPASFGLQA